MALANLLVNIGQFVVALIDPAILIRRKWGSGLGHSHPPPQKLVRTEGITAEDGLAPWHICGRPIQGRHVTLFPALRGNSSDRRHMTTSVVNK